MKKIIAIVLAVSSLFFVMVSKSLAEISLGISGTAGVYEATGTEKLSGGRTNSSSEYTSFGYPTIFAEYNVGPASVGLEMIAGSVTTEEEQRTDYNTSEPGGSNVCTGNDFCGSSGTNKASVEVSRHITLYGLLPIMDSGAYIKAGLSRMNVETKESLATGSTYGDVSGVGGEHVSLGYQHNTDGGFVRLEVGYSAYDNVSATSSTGHVVDVDIEGGFARLSFGRSF